MSDWFEWLRNRGSIPMGDVIEFKPPTDRKIEHVDSSTIVERLELTPEMRAEFEAAGYTFEDYDENQRAKDRGDKAPSRKTKVIPSASEPGRR